MLLIALTGCSNKADSDIEPPGPVDSASLPDSEVRGATIYLYTRGVMDSEIRAGEIIQYEDKDSTMGYHLDMDFFDSVGSLTSTLVADSGVIHEQAGYFEVYGHVVVNTGDSSRLDTDYLIWNPRTNKIETDAYVTVTRPGQVFTGWGFEADRGLSRFKILSQSSGTVTDTRNLTE